MKLSTLFLLFVLCLPVFASKPLFVTTTTDLAWAAKEIAKDRIEVVSLLKGTENPHYLDATPRFIRQVSNADALCSVGLELEVGWLPKVLSRSGNARVQNGGAGFCETANAVNVLDKITGPVDRSMGDVHPAGNPHFWLSPLALAKAAKKMSGVMAKIDPKNAEFFKKNVSELDDRLKKLFQQNAQKLAQIKKGTPQIIEYHKEFTYLLDVYGLVSFGSIEEKPGVAPSAGRLASAALQAKQAGLSAVLAATYTPRDKLNKFNELSGIPLVIVPTSVQTSGRFKDYITLHNHIVDSLLKHLKETGQEQTLG